MKQKTIICPNPKCGREHALYWYIGTGGKQLMYRCDRVERIGHSKHTGNPIPVRTVAAISAPPDIVPADDIPEEWSGPAAKKESDKLQQTLL